MRFNRIHLKNYRKHVDTEIVFSNGITAIIGNNGSGKTTIFEAILFSLFGVVAISGDKSKVKSKKNPNEITKVEFEFSISECNYMISRTVKGSNSIISSVLFKDNVEIAKTTSAVNEEIKKILGSDYRSFNVSIFARQKEISSLSNMDTGERRSVIPRLIGIEGIDVAIKQVKNDKKSLSDEYDFKNKNMEDISDLRLKIYEKKQFVLNGGNNISILKKEIEKIDLLVSELRNEIDENNAIASKYSGLKKELDINNSMFLEKKKNICEIKEKIEKINELKKTILSFDREKIEKEILILRDVVDKDSKKKNTNSMLENIKSEISEIEYVNSKREKEQEELSGLFVFDEGMEDALCDALKKVNNSIVESEKHIAVLEDRIIALNKNIELLDGAPICPTCESEISDKDSLFDSFNEEINKNNNTINNTKQKIEDLLVKRDKLNKKLSSVRDAEANKIRINNSLNSYKLKCDEIFKTKEKMIGIIDIFNGSKKTEIDDNCNTGSFDESLVFCKEWCFKLSNEINLIDIDEKTGKIIALEDKINKISITESTVKNLEYMFDDFNKLKLELVKLKEEILLKNNEICELGEIKDIEALKFKLKEIELEKNKNTDMLNKHMVSIGICNGEIKNLNERMDDFNVKLIEIKKIESEIMLLAGLVEKMNSFKTYLLSKIRPQLNRIASGMIEKITCGKYNTIELDENYDIYIKSFGENETLCFHSGGEGDLANIVVRIAISKLIAQKFKCLVLDEAFAFQDSGRTSEIISSFRRLIGNSFDQMLIITHDPFIREKCDNLILVKEDENECSIVSCM